MMQSGVPVEERIYKGTIDCAKKVAEAEGVPGFFKGAGSNILRGLGGAIVLAVYDESSRSICIKPFVTNTRNLSSHD